MKLPEVPWVALVAFASLLGCSGGNSGSATGVAPGGGGDSTTGGATSLGGSSSLGGGGAATPFGGSTGSGGVGSGGVGSGGTSPGGTTGGGGATATGGTNSGGLGGSVASGGSDAAGGSGSGGAPPACPMTALAPGDTNESLMVGGVNRTYVRHVPTGYAGTTPVPLIIDFHPLFGTGAVERASSGYAALADREGFVVVFPDGIDAAWNIGPCCTSSRTVDDLGFARALVAKLESAACIDPKRVYATGYSMGGGMSHFLACNAADVFAAVAPSAFDLLTPDEEPCAPSRPITVISFRGTADPIVPYAGGASNPPNGLPVTIHFQGAQGTFATWAKLDGCTGSPTDAGGGCSTYSACSAGTEVTLCTAQGGGHVTGDANTGWAMMKRHPMP